jgi:hypothetical protein
MKYIITESQKDRAIIKWLNSEYGDLTPIETEKHPNYIFFIKDGEVVFDYNKKIGYVTISYDKIWSILESFLELEYDEIQDLTKEWVVEHFKLRVRRICNSLGFYNDGWTENITDKTKI